ncbi:MAG: hypothetical protein AVDCRST_MAG73-207 [uncultured Thermomicrobiales bacterium]|uniref:Uncharacterized protein n=1 Tax=uncultured Thermomicrobiales bacterium TaxID=1645740 RepID=A0A6J4TFI8_9BACT|nr:MAG: hypothetical protein AVDCRST_MAG73-207 [uncultured Thermomicrobiales bacterium]
MSWSSGRIVARAAGEAVRASAPVPRGRPIPGQPVSRLRSGAPAQPPPRRPLRSGR